MAKRTSGMENNILCSRESEGQGRLRNTIKRCAFTLAEVLITLAIIGVVAALTIPTVMHKIQQQELYSRFMKAYNTLSNVQMQLKTEGLVDDISFAAQGGGTAYTMNKILDLLKYTVKCQSGDSQCFRKIPLNTKTLSGYDTQPVSKFRSQLTLYSMPDGIDFQITDYSMMPSASRYIRGYMMVTDINGAEKGPNVSGRDRFTFFFHPYQKTIGFNNTTCYTNYLQALSGYRPLQTDDSKIYTYCDVSSSNADPLNGLCCGLRLLKERKMDY